MEAKFEARRGTTTGSRFEAEVGKLPAEGLNEFYVTSWAKSEQGRGRLACARLSKRCNAQNCSQHVILTIKSDCSSSLNKIFVHKFMWKQKLKISSFQGLSICCTNHTTIKYRRLHGAALLFKSLPLCTC